jgi:hypothetical protein
LPFLHVGDHRVGHPRDQIPGHLGAIDIGQVVGDIAGRHALRIQRQHRVVEPGQPPRVLGHHDRAERADPVSRHVDPHLADIGAHRLAAAAVTHVPRPGPLPAVVAQMIGQLDIQRRLQDPLGQPGQQAARAGQLDALRARRRHQLLGHRRKVRLDQWLLDRHLSDVRGHA